MPNFSERLQNENEKCQTLDEIGDKLKTRDETRKLDENERHGKSSQSSKKCFKTQAYIEL